MLRRKLVKRLDQRHLLVFQDSNLELRKSSVFIQYQVVPIEWLKVHFRFQTRIQGFRKDLRWRVLQDC